ncbi:MAG: hypothetical protein ACLFVK_04870 [Dehalococcoidia bacterium]
MGIERLYGGFLQRDVIDEDFGEGKLGKELAEKFAGKHRGSVRISTGRYYSREEWEKRRKKLLRLKLPG